jgi:hypothetical protein
VVCNDEVIKTREPLGPEGVAVLRGNQRPTAR